LPNILPASVPEGNGTTVAAVVDAFFQTNPSVEDAKQVPSVFEPNLHSVHR
jgi:hypothetical protein